MLRIIVVVLSGVVGGGAGVGKVVAVEPFFAARVLCTSNSLV